MDIPPPISLPVPTGLSPSRIASFKDCGLAFRFSSIDKLPEPPSVPAARGTLVHRALELLFCDPGPERTRNRASECLATAVAETEGTPDGDVLGLSDPEQAEATIADAERLVDGLFELEDPSEVVPLGLEIRLQAEIGGARVRGVIDRLERTPDGGLVVTDYKTGRAPSQMSEQRKLLGIVTYAAMVEKVLGRRPDRIQLLHLAEPVIISTQPTAQQVRGTDIRVGAVWKAVERACSTADFRPRTGPLCNWCAFQAYCPAQGGDPSGAWEQSAVRAALTATAA